MAGWTWGGAQILGKATGAIGGGRPFANWAGVWENLFLCCEHVEYVRTCKIDFCGADAATFPKGAPGRRLFSGSRSQISVKETRSYQKSESLELRVDVFFVCNWLWLWDQCLTNERQGHLFKNRGQSLRLMASHRLRPQRLKRGIGGGRSHPQCEILCCAC